MAVSKSTGSEGYMQQFKKGSYEMILLSLIAEKETYGYEIITRLNEKGGKIFAYAKEGTIYPILYRMQNAGLIRCRIAPSPANGGSKKYYSITDIGRKTLKERLLFWTEYKKCVDGLVQTNMDLEK